jgi:hypothetical protein
MFPGRWLDAGAAGSPVITDGIRNEEDLENLLAEPSEADCEAIAKLDGNLLLVGAGGKMGPSLARRARRAVQRVGSRTRVIAVARFQSSGLKEQLAADGIETISADLLDRMQVDALPEAANVVLFMADVSSARGASRSRAVNAYAPGSRRRALSTFPDCRLLSVETFIHSSLDSGGATEGDSVPVGDTRNRRGASVLKIFLDGSRHACRDLGELRRRALRCRSTSAGSIERRRSIPVTERVNLSGG